jgi:cytochrome P450
MAAAADGSGARTGRGAAAPRASLREVAWALPKMRRDPLAVWQRYYDRYGPVVCQPALGRFDTYYLFGPEANRFLMLDREHVFSAMRSWTLIMGRIFPNGLLLRDGEDHRHHRKIMHGAFTTPALREYAERMNPLIEEGLAAWRAKGERFLAFDAFKELTLHLATRIFLGLDLPAAAERELRRAFEATVAASMSLVRFDHPRLEFGRGLAGRQYLVRLFGAFVEEKRRGDGRDMFSLLCRAETEDGRRYADAEIVDHLIFLMMAAHDTTTSALTSLVYELAKHPAWQERVRSECSALGEAHLPYERMDELTGVRLVLNETLRRYPPLSTIPRVSTRDFEFAGYRIPGNRMVCAVPLHTHYMKEYWSEPERFDPERFAPGREEHERHTHQWVPFGGGAHMCLGVRFAEMQLRLVLHQLVRRFRWSVPAGYAMPVQQAPISKPLDGLPLRLEAIETR